MKVAVYGSLRKGFGNHRLLDGLEACFEGFVEVPYRMVSLGAFPGLVPHAEKSSVYLEVYELDSDERLRRLDGLEGYRGPNADNFYDRVVIPDFEVGGEGVHVYVLDNSYSNSQPVTSGDWDDYRKSGSRSTSY